MKTFEQFCTDHSLCIHIDAEEIATARVVWDACKKEHEHKIRNLETAIELQKQTLTFYKKSMGEPIRELVERLHEAEKLITQASEADTVGDCVAFHKRACEYKKKYLSEPEVIQPKEAE